MDATQVWRVMECLGSPRSGPEGITWGPIRVQRGGGIAGNLGEWWVVFPGEPDIAPLGPFTNPLALRVALRKAAVRIVPWVGLDLTPVPRGGTK